MTNNGFIITEDLPEIIKDTLDKVDYNINWGPRLADFSASISTSVWTVPSGLVEATPAPAVDGDVTTIFLSGGSTQNGTKHIIRNIITTAAPDPRILVKSFIIVMALR